MVGAHVETVLVRRGGGAVAFDLGAEVVAGWRGDGAVGGSRVGWIWWCAEGESGGEEGKESGEMCQSEFHRGGVEG